MKTIETKKIPTDYCNVCDNPQIICRQEQFGILRQLEEKEPALLQIALDAATKKVADNELALCCLSFFAVKKCTPAAAPQLIQCEKYLIPEDAAIEVHTSIAGTVYEDNYTYENISIRVVTET